MTAIYARPAWRTAWLSWLEARPVVQIIFAGRFISAALLAFPSTHRITPIAFGALAWVSATVAVYVFNGVSDVAEDRANGSKRPIASGRLSTPAAFTVIFFAAVLALAIGNAAGIGTQVTLFLLLGYLYSAQPIRAKRRSSSASLVVVALGGLTFWAGTEVAGGWSRNSVVFGLFLSAWMGLGGAFLKDLSDVHGDAVAGRRTFAVLYGTTLASRIAAVSSILIGSTALITASIASPILVPAMTVLAAGAGWVAFRCLHLSSGFDRQDMRLPYRAFMATQYATIATAIMSVIIAMLGKL